MVQGPTHSRILVLILVVVVYAAHTAVEHSVDEAKPFWQQPRGHAGIEGEDNKRQ